MKKVTVFLSAAVIVCLLNPVIILAQDSTMSMGSQDDMQLIMPGPMHQQMAKHAGEWKSAIKFWMAPGGDPVSANGKISREMILGGRYLKSTSKTDVPGATVESFSVMGYDNITKQFTNVYMDNFGTGTTVEKGVYEGTKTINWTGMMSEPQSKSEIPFREVMTLTDENNERVEMYVNRNGKEYKIMEMILTR